MVHLKERSRHARSSCADNLRIVAMTLVCCRFNIGNRRESFNDEACGVASYNVVRLIIRAPYRSAHATSDSRQGRTLSRWTIRVTRKALVVAAVSAMICMSWCACDSQPKDHKYLSYVRQHARGRNCIVVPESEAANTKHVLEVQGAQTRCRVRHSASSLASLRIVEELDLLNYGC